MKKTITTLAVATALAAPLTANAAATMYGSIRLVANSTSHDDPALERDISIDNAASRFGLRGSEELGNGLKVGGRYEFGVSSDKGDIQDNNRLSYISVEGGFGEIQAGRVWSTYWNVVGLGWPAIDYSGDGLDEVTTFRLSDSIKWTKNFGAASISLLAVLDDGAQRTQGSVGFKTGGFSFGLGFDQLIDESSVTTATDKDANAEDDLSTALSIGYALDNGLGFTAIIATDDNGVDDATTGYNVNGIYSANDNTFILSYGDNNTDADDDESISVELARKLGERSTAWVALQSTDPSTSVQLGLRHNW